MNILDNIVKQLRVNRGLTQEELAKELDVSRHTIISIENGGNTTGRMVLKIANYFGKDPREIFFTTNGVQSLQKRLA